MATVSIVEKVFYRIRKRAEACDVRSRNILLTSWPGEYIGVSCGRLAYLTVPLPHVYIEADGFVVNKIFTEMDDQQTKSYRQQQSSCSDVSHP